MTFRKYEKKFNLEPISILALTASAFESDKEKCLSFGMNDIITKPIKMDDFVHKLNKYVKTTENTVTDVKENKTSEKEFLDKEKIVNAAAIEMGLDKEDVEDLIDTFFNDFIKQKDMLKSAFAKQDYVQVNEIAHSIAGASANLRINEISVPARDLNVLLKDKDSYTETELVRAKEIIDKLLSIIITTC